MSEIFFNMGREILHLHVLFFLLYKILITYKMTFFGDFPKISFQKLSEGQMDVSKHFPKMSEDC